MGRGAFLIDPRDRSVVLFLVGKQLSRGGWWHGASTGLRQGSDRSFRRAEHSSVSGRGRHWMVAQAGMENWFLDSDLGYTVA